MKYLHENKADITATDNYAVYLASRNGHLNVVKYLHENKADITANDNETVRRASKNGHLHVVLYIAKKTETKLEWFEGKIKQHMASFKITRQFRQYVNRRKLKRAVAQIAWRPESKLAQRHKKEMADFVGTFDN